MVRCFHEDLPASQNVARLRALGVIRADTKLVELAFGDGSKRWIAVCHRRFPRHGDWAFFICPRCGRRVRLLKLVADAPMCWRCCSALGFLYRSAGGSVPERAEAHALHIERMRARLADPLVRRRRASLEHTLERARMFRLEDTLRAIEELSR